MSLYVRLQSSFWNHRKTFRLRASIGDAAYWVPPRLWSYAAEYQPDGDFSGYGAGELAMLIGYSGDAQAMLKALQTTGFMDEMQVHDWEHHNEYHATFADRARKAAQARWSKRKEPKEKIKKEKVNRDKHCSSIAQAMLQAFPQGFKEEWEAFKIHRKAKRAPLTERAEELLLTVLSERPQDATEAAQMAIMGNWTGFKWEWFDNAKAKNGEVRISPQQRQEKINKLNQRKQELIRRFPDPLNMPGIAQAQLSKITAELQTL